MMRPAPTGIMSLADLIPSNLRRLITFDHVP